MMRKIALLAAVAVVASLALTPARAFADTTSASCLNTSYVDGTNSTSKKKNFGSATDLVIKGATKYAYLECSLTSVPAGATITGVTLDVFSRSVSTAHTVRLHTANAGWTETGLTWNNQPGFNATVLDSKPGDVVPGSGEWVNLNAAAVVTGNGTWRFALDTTTATDQFYASDDYTTDLARRPKLTVTYSTGVVAPTASFTANPMSGTVPLSVAFTDTSTGSPTSWLWDFGDGQTSTTQSPSHTYSAVGSYTVTLTASNAAGSSTATQTITVNQVPAPTASFTATPTSGTAPLAVQFTDTSTGSPTGWGWDFGDGGTSTAQNPSHTYTTAGTYTVTLTASNPGGSSTASTTITVNAAPPPGPNWVLAFDDQFNDGVVPSHWTRYSGTNGSNDPNDCSDPNLWSVSNGELLLPFKYQTSGPCGATWYNASGMDNSTLGKSVDQKIVIRWRLDGTVLPHYVIPMRWDADPDPNLTWDKLEQDWCERPSGYTTFTGCQTHNHYQLTSPCCIDSPIYNVDLTQWHTWEFTTYQHRLTTSIDGVVMWDYQGDNTTVPNGLRRDVLQVECKTTCPTDTSLFANAHVDYMTTYYPS